MKFVSSFILFVIATLAAQGQERIQFTTFPAQPATEQTLLGMRGDDIFQTGYPATTADISYYDSTEKIFIRQFPRVSQGIYFVSQRFTSPSPQTYLDSAKIFFPTIAVGDVRVDVFRDTTLEIVIAGKPMDFHLPNLYVQSTDYIRFDTVRILMETIEENKYHTAVFSGKLMTEEFHLQFSPRKRGDLIDPAFTLRMSADSLLISEISPENSRICFVIVDGSTGVYWENSSNPNALFAPNLDMFASVHYEGGTGIEEIPSAGGVRIAGIFPHPVSQSKDGGATIALNVGAEQNIDIAVYDVMGRKVRNVMQAAFPYGNQLLNLPVSGLAPGTYLVRANGKRMSATKTLVITN